MSFSGTQKHDGVSLPGFEQIYVGQIIEVDIVDELEPLEDVLIDSGGKVTLIYGEDNPQAQIIGRITELTKDKAHILVLEIKEIENEL